MASREELHEFLTETIGPNVYYQPPPNVALEYPCIVYRLSSLRTRHADNLVYSQDKAYTLTYITRDPDDPSFDIIAGMPKTSFDRQYVFDNLYHNIFTVFY